MFNPTTPLQKGHEFRMPSSEAVYTQNLGSIPDTDGNRDQSGSGRQSARGDESPRRRQSPGGEE